MAKKILTGLNLTNELQSNGSAGTSGQVLTSAGSGAVPTWGAVPPTVYSQSTQPTGGNVGDVWIDTSTSVNSWSSFMPFATAAGTGTVSVTSASPWSTGTATVTFPVGRFNTGPVVTATSVHTSSSPIVLQAQSVTSSGCTLRASIYSSVSVALSVNWTAVQMTSTTAEG